MAVEVNIDPAKSVEEFEHNIHGVFREVRKIVPKSLNFGFVPAVVFMPTVLDKTPEIHKELGCSPDWNAYTSLQNPTPLIELKKIPHTRSAGGHLAIGWGEFDKTDQSHIFDCEEVIRTIDPFYTNVCHFWDKDTVRSRLYGKPGAYRPTIFGVEYRTPSNAWLRYPKLYPFMFQLAVASMNSMFGDGDIEVPILDKSEVFHARID